MYIVLTNPAPADVWVKYRGRKTEDRNIHQAPLNSTVRKQKKQNMKLREITEQPWINIIAGFAYCSNCLFVDRDVSRGFEGIPCSRCGHPSDGFHNYYSITITNLIDLIQDFYFLSPHKESPAFDYPENFYDPKTINKFAILVFYCTLGETLLENLLLWIMSSLDLPDTLRQKLLKDNRFQSQRAQDLFPSLVGEKWNKAIVALSKSSIFDYSKTMELYLEVVNYRNDLLHLGKTWSLPENLPDECVDHLESLMYLFVDMHNRYIPKPLGNDDSNINSAS